MEPVQGAKGLVLPDVAAFTRPVLPVFDEIADHQPDEALDRGEDSHDPASPADLHVQALLAVGVNRRVGLRSRSAHTFTKIKNSLYVRYR